VIYPTEGLDIGMDVGSPVDSTYSPPFKFIGTIEKVTINLADPFADPLSLSIGAILITNRLRIWCPRRLAGTS
jgi:hypothetical protein